MDGPRSKRKRLGTAAFDDDEEKPADACDRRTGDETRERRCDKRAYLEFIVALFAGNEIVHVVIDADKPRPASFIF